MSDDLVKRGQDLIAKIVASEDSNERQMLHQELTELLKVLTGRKSMR